MRRIVLAALLIASAGCGSGGSPAAAKGGCRTTGLPDRDRINDALGHVPDRASPLGRAVLCDDAAGVEAALKAGADSDAREPGGETPVLFAAAIPRTALLKRLLAAGGDADTYERDAHTLALTYSLSAGVNYDDWSAWDVLLAGGANINFRPPGGATIAEEAVSLGAIDRLLMLLDRGYRNDPARLARALETSRFNAATEPKRLQALERVRDIKPAQ